MNPILLKPNSVGASQVVVNGRVWKTLPPRAYYEHAAELRGHVRAAYDRLARRFDFVVIEGAGSMSEMNLRDGLVNLDSPCACARLDAGCRHRPRGVFASSSDARPADTGGAPAAAGIRRSTGSGATSRCSRTAPACSRREPSHCFGVFPYAPDITIDAEDSLALQTARPPRAGGRPHRPRPPAVHLECDRLPAAHVGGLDSAAPDGRFRFRRAPRHEELDCLFSSGSIRPALSAWVLGQRRRGATVLGICGGFQMMGRRIDDSSARREARSATMLGLLPVVTVMGPDKRTEVKSATTKKA